jgi:trans-aconitate methyltransferase
MSADFYNVYDDMERADAYAKLEFPGTYFLAYRDLPAIIGEVVAGGRALDFGCGTGRSTRFLSRMGFEPVVGVDISEQMIQRAQQIDPDNRYLLIQENDFRALEQAEFDFISAIFTFDNIPAEQKLSCLAALKPLLAENGTLLILVSAPQIYCHEWASFSTKDYPENRTAQSGDLVRIVMLDVEDQRPVEDILYTDQSYRALFDRAGFQVKAVHQPLAKAEEAFTWVSETTIAPWAIYLLQA